MIAAVYHAPGDVRVEDMPEPGDPQRLRCRARGHARRDLRHRRLRVRARAEVLPDRRAAPVQRAPGARRSWATSSRGGSPRSAREATGLAVGDRVVCGAGVSCGTCEWCLRGRTNLCATYYTLGLHCHGGLAPYVRTPAALCRTVPGDLLGRRRGDGAAAGGGAARAAAQRRAAGPIDCRDRRGRHRLVPGRRRGRLGRRRSDRGRHRRRRASRPRARSAPRTRCTPAARMRSRRSAP